MSSLIRQAYTLPKGDPKRRNMLAKLTRRAKVELDDLNVSYQGYIDGLTDSFTEKVLDVIMDAATKGTPLAGKAGYRMHGTGGWYVQSREYGEIHYHIHVMYSPQKKQFSVTRRVLDEDSQAIVKPVSMKFDTMNTVLSMSLDAARWINGDLKSYF